MAKVPFSKLKCKIDDSIKQVKINEEITIEVKQYLPIQEKLGLIGRVIDIVHEQDMTFSNPVKFNVFTEMEIIFNYTNIAFTDKNKEDIPKTYDSLKSSGILDKILKEIPKEELECIVNGVINTADSIYGYQNSVLGILDSLKVQSENNDFDLKSILETLKTMEDIPTLREIS